MENVHDEKLLGRSSVVNDALVSSVDKKIKVNTWVTMTILADEFPHVSRIVLHEIVNDCLGYHKVCSKMLKQNTKWLSSALPFITGYNDNDEEEEFLNQILTGN